MCQSKKLQEFLHHLPNDVDRVIINGDLFDSIDFTRLCKSQWKVLSELRKLSDQLQLVWVIGNHDIGAEIVAHLIGAVICDEYRLEDEGVLILHGHVFDKFIFTYPKITWIADVVYFALQKISMKLARFVKYQSKTFLRCSDLVASRAISYANQEGYDRVCCGHTHHALQRGGYYNSGCWTEDVCHYLEIKNGDVQLRTYQ